MTTQIESPLQLMREHRVNLLLLGFPKCGTTAFADWISDCPEVDVTNPKETFLFCPEFAGNMERTNRAELSECFSANSRASLRMEASTLNAYSPSVLECAKANDDLKCIVLVRDPVEVAISWHNQMRHAGIHRHEDFVASWNAGLSNDASSGPEMLQRYDMICRHGYWTQRWLEVLGHERCLVFHSTELKSDAQAVKKMLERFLGTELNVAQRIAERNAFSQPRNKKLYTALRTSFAKKIWGSIERAVPATGHLRRYVRDRFLLKKVAKTIDPDIVQLVSNACAEDQRLLADLVAKNRSVWPL